MPKKTVVAAVGVVDLGARPRPEEQKGWWRGTIRRPTRWLQVETRKANRPEATLMEVPQERDAVERAVMPVRRTVLG